MQLISGISSDLWKLLKYFNGTAIVGYFRIPLTALSSRATAFPNNLALYFKDLSALKLIVSSFEKNYKLPVDSE